MKKIIIVSISLCIIVTVISAITYSKNIKTPYEFGQLQRNVNENTKDNKILVSVNKEGISDRQIETYMALSADGLTKEEAKQKLINDRLLIQNAKKKGIVVSDEEVKQYIDESKQYQNDNPELAQPIYDYIAGLGITEDEYWNMMEPSIKERMYIGKLKKQLRTDFEQQYTYKNSKNAVQFEEYVMKYVNQLKEQAVIVDYEE